MVTINDIPSTTKEKNLIKSNYFSNPTFSKTVLNVYNTKQMKIFIFENNRNMY